MSGDENTGVVVVDRPSATAGIAAIRKQQTTITDAGSAGAGLFDRVSTALGITIPGQAAVEVPTGGADTVRQQAAAISRRTGAVADGLESWMNTELGIQQSAAQAVNAADGKSGTVDGSFAGITASGTASVADTPQAADPDVKGPPAFTMKNGFAAKRGGSVRNISMPVTSATSPAGAIHGRMCRCMPERSRAVTIER